MGGFVLGIDPGLSGAIALISSSGRLIDMQDMPVADKRVMGSLLYKPPNGSLVGVEFVHSMPGQGVSSTFKFGAAWGGVVVAYQALGYPVRDVRPQEWKKHFNITGRDKKAQKEKALRLATERWPHEASFFARKKDVGRAEAALIGLYLVETTL